MIPLNVFTFAMLQLEEAMIFMLVLASRSSSFNPLVESIKWPKFVCCNWPNVPWFLFMHIHNLVHALCTPVCCKLQTKTDKTIRTLNSGMTCFCSNNFNSAGTNIWIFEWTLLGMYSKARIHVSTRNHIIEKRITTCFASHRFTTLPAFAPQFLKWQVKKRAQFVWDYRGSTQLLLTAKSIQTRLGCVRIVISS